jgi:excisionase family DNA binding protein
MSKKKKKKLDLNNLPALLTPKEVAQLLRVSVITLKRWGKKGKLPAIRINERGDRRYRREVVLRFLGIDPENQ